MNQLTPYQQALVDRSRAFLPRAEQRRIAQAKLFVAALPPIPAAPKLDRLAGVNRRALLRPQATERGFLTSKDLGRSMQRLLGVLLDRGHV